MLSDADRDKGAVALDAAFANTDVRAAVPLAGGASGAHVYRVVTDDGDFLLRIEGARRPYRNPHQYTCLSAAAAAGIAPPVRHLDADAGVVIMPFLETVPLTEFPGGPAAVGLAGPWNTPPRTTLAPLAHKCQFPSKQFSAQKDCLRQ